MNEPTDLTATEGHSEQHTVMAEKIDWPLAVVQQ